MNVEFVGSITFEQVALIVLLLGMMATFALDRWRVETVAMCGLALGFAIGLVPAGDVFSGFASPAVITVAEILLIVQALGRSRIVERGSAIAGRYLRSDVSALAFLCGVAGFLSVFMNNIGALALILPVTVSLSARLGLSLRLTLMPVSFATLLGGLCSLVGTPANLVISQARADSTGELFAFFDLAWTGVPVAVLGIGFVVLWSVYSPRYEINRKSPAGRTVRDRRMVTELRLPSTSPLVGRTGADCETALDARLFGIVRDGSHVFGRPANLALKANDVLVIELTPVAADAAHAEGTVEPLVPIRPAVHDGVVAEAVVMPQSIFVGSKIATLEPLTACGVHTIGVIPQRVRVESRLADVQLAIGDVLIVEGPREALDDALDQSDLFRLTERERSTPAAHSYKTVAAFAVGIVLAAWNIFPAEIAFGLVVLALSATGAMSLREGLPKLNWSILVMLGAMIPLGAAVDSTGVARLLSQVFIGALPFDGTAAVAGGMMAVAILLTPFVNNVSTAVILAPIAVEIALTTGLPPEPLLIAVALGASLDFLTPFGHHNNTLVMGVAGYRFADYPKTGVPLLLLTSVVGVIAIGQFWT